MGNLVLNFERFYQHEYKQNLKFLFFMLAIKN